jgi:hypothetical protein
MEGRFFEQETTEGAMRVLWRWIELYGIPRALYTDRKNLYITARLPTAQEQLAGEPALTSFGKACHRLGSRSSRRPRRRPRDASRGGTECCRTGW